MASETSKILNWAQNFQLRKRVNQKKWFFSILFKIILSSLTDLAGQINIKKYHDQIGPPNRFTV